MKKMILAIVFSLIFVSLSKADIRVDFRYEYYRNPMIYYPPTIIYTQPYQPIYFYPPVFGYPIYSYNHYYYPRHRYNSYSHSNYRYNDYRYYPSYRDSYRNHRERNYRRQ